MPFKRTHYRAEWASGLSQSDKENFIDGFFDDCAKDGIEGLIVAGEGSGQFILEGDENFVDNAVGSLDSANELVNGDAYYDEGSAPQFSCLTSHMTPDCRDKT